MDIKETLRTLCAAPGVSGDEFPASRIAAEMLREYAENVMTDSFGNVTGTVGGGRKKPLLLLDAHIDRIGLVATHITDGGFIKFGGIGMDRRLLSAQRVTVHGKEDIKGVISTLPPHVAKGDKAPKIEDMAIDVGMTKEQAEKAVSLGDTITIDGEFSELGESRVCSPATDDRAGVTALLYALELLKKEKDPAFNIAVLFAVQEEVGGMGTQIAAFNIAPDYGIAVDVTFAKTKDTPSENIGELGKGPMIGIAPSLDREMSKRLINIAEDKKIPFTREVMSSSTGTDADDISVTKGGVRTALLSIPQKYMHTPCEIVDIEDIKNTAALIAEFIKEGM